ncbi:MAG TPA: DciA family protein [Gammaproteobacteria bacterium]
MAPKKPASLSGLLTAPGAHLQALTAEAQKLEALRQCVLRVLSPEAAPHCLGADLKDGVLTLFLDSGAWTTALRYQHQPLLAVVQAEARQPCHTLRLKVLPDPKPGVPPKPAPRSLSAETRQLLESTAGGVDDPALAGSLKRLARGHKPRP